MRSKTMYQGYESDWESQPGDFSRTAVKDKPNGLAAGGGAGSEDMIFMEIKFTKIWKVFWNFAKNKKLQSLFSGPNDGNKLINNYNNQEFNYKQL